MDQQTTIPIPVDSTEPAGAPIGFVEFVALVAALMSLTALGIDSMLPALPAIGESLGVAAENEPAVHHHRLRRSASASRSWSTARWRTGSVDGRC